MWRLPLKLSNITVDCIDCMGTDLSVVNAARVSFNKVSEKLNANDSKLIKYLADHNHWSPFSHAFASFRIKAPIFVARQLVKHTVGLAWNEVSRRYVSDRPEFYLPDFWRKASDNVKQGSSEEKADYNNVDSSVSHIERALFAYREMLNHEVCAEQARMILPQNTMTEWIWSGSLYAFARVCNLRLDSHTQKETQQVAQQISNHMKELFPVSWGVLVNEPNN